MSNMSMLLPEERQKSRTIFEVHVPIQGIQFYFNIQATDLIEFFYIIHQFKRCNTIYIGIIYVVESW